MGSQYYSKMQKHSISAFIDKTWTMLESEGYQHVICWNEDGISFAIMDQPEFEKEVLPIYFKHSNLTSFQRQLNMYNFHKKKTEKGHTEYHHRLFRRNQRQLLKAIRRKPSEDQIEIGEELLRKLRQEHEETHHEILPQEENPNSLENNRVENLAQEPRQEQPRQEQTPPSLNYVVPEMVPPPMMWYYIPNAYQMPWQPVVYAPQRIINTHILIQTPENDKPSF